MAGDLQLLREVLRWARANGIKHNDSGRGRHDPNGGWAVHYRSAAGRRYVTTEPEITVYRRTPYRSTTLAKVTVREAVNVLVDFGILPTEFHSAFAAGRASVLDAAQRLGRTSLEGQMRARRLAPPWHPEAEVSNAA